MEAGKINVRKKSSVHKSRGAGVLDILFGRTKPITCFSDIAAVVTLEVIRRRQPGKTINPVLASYHLIRATEFW